MLTIIDLLYFKFLNCNLEGGLDARWQLPPILTSIYSSDFFEKKYQILETVFHRLSKHLEFRQKYSAGSRIFNSLLVAWVSL